MVFAFRDYKAWLRSVVDSQGERGARAKIASAAGCQRAFLSQVLNGDANLTADHVAGVAEYLGLDERETEYFHALVAYARAGSKKLRSYLDRRLNKLAKEHKHLGERLKRPAPRDSLAMEYYSDWTYTAIHMLLTIPRFRDERAIAARLHLDPATVLHHLRRLEEWGLASRGKDHQWRTDQATLHIPSEHVMTAVHHRNWRLKAADQSASRGGATSTPFHFTAVCSLSADDLRELQRRATEFVMQTKDLVGPSKEEELACICLDVFSP